MRTGFWHRSWGCGRNASLKQNHLAEWFEASSSVELSFDLLDAVRSAFGATGTPLQGESGCHGVEVSKHVGREAGEAGQLACVEGVDPGGERGTEAASEYLAEVANVPGGSIQFGAAGQDVLLESC